jgi:hypothetical protein
MAQRVMPVDEKMASTAQTMKLGIQRMTPVSPRMMSITPIMELAAKRMMSEPLKVVSTAQRVTMWLRAKAHSLVVDLKGVDDQRFWLAS